MSVYIRVYMCLYIHMCTWKHAYHEYIHIHPFKYSFSLKGVCKAHMGTYFQTANAVFSSRSVCFHTQKKSDSELLVKDPST